MPRARPWLVLLACAILLGVQQHMAGARTGPARTADRFARTGAMYMGPSDVPAEVRARGLQFDASVAPADRAWMEQAIQAANPSARALIQAIDGAVTVRATGLGDDRVGEAGTNGAELRVDLDVARLAGAGRFVQQQVLVHELGHVVDFAFMDHAVEQQLGAGIPTSPCTDPERIKGGCASREERFAETFAKWALPGDRVAFLVGDPETGAAAGYSITTPPDLAAWGAPLDALAAK